MGVGSIAGPRFTILKYNGNAGAAFRGIGWRFGIPANREAARRTRSLASADCRPVSRPVYRTERDAFYRTRETRFTEQLQIGEAGPKSPGIGQILKGREQSGKKRDPGKRTGEIGTLVQTEQHVQSTTFPGVRGTV